MMIHVGKILLLILVFHSGYANGQNDTITTFVGNGNIGFSGDGGLAINAEIGFASQGCFDHIGNYYFTIRTQHRVRKVSSDGIISTISGTGNSGFSGDGNLAVNAELDNPTGICIDSLNNVYISDMGNDRIRKIDVSTGIISTIAGNGNNSSSGDGGLATSASLNAPCGICIDFAGNIYITEASGHFLRRITPLGIITTIAGTGQNGYNGDGQLALDARLANPLGVTCDSIGNVFICDKGNNRIRKVNIATDSIITVVGGNGTGNFNGDNIPANTAEVVSMGAIFNSVGEMIITDLNQRIRKVDADGIIHTVAGTGVAGYSGDGNLANLAQVYNPEGIAVDSCDNIYFCDLQNRRIRKIKLNECEPVHSEFRTNQKALVNIYPTPAYSQITIVANSKLKETSITNTVGQIVLHQNINKEKAEIDIAHLQAGIYFVTVTDAEGAKMVKKIIKE